MFWLIAMIASLGVGTASVIVALNRMGGDLAGLFRAAPDLEPSAFAEGAYGKITGVVSSATEALDTPGSGAPSVLYEMTVYKTHGDNTQWRLVHQRLHGKELEITTGDVSIRVAVGDVYLLDAPATDHLNDLRTNAPGDYGWFRTRVRFVPEGATVQIVGTLTREVDADPSAQNDYREVATRYRLLGRRKQPLILSCKLHKQLPTGPSGP
ncbi:MAG: hypothetical protein ACKV2T_23890 [Kofleriaceae bacterium]